MFEKKIIPHFVTCLGGGLGGTRRGGPDVNVKHSGREELRSAVGGDDKDRERRRSRSHTPIQRERRRRSHSRSRDRERRRDRKRRPSREKSRDDRDRDGALDGAIADDIELEDRKDKIEKRRSRSRERPERGERERKRTKRSRSRSRDRERDRKRRDRDRDRGKRDRGDRDAYGEKPVQIKQEPVDDGYENNGNSGEFAGNENDDSYGYSGSQYDEYSRDGMNEAGQYNSYYSATGVKSEPPE